MQKTALDVLNESIVKKIKTRQQNVKYISENRDAWNEYQARYARERRARDPEYRDRTNAAKLRYQEKKKAQLANA